MACVKHQKRIKELEHSVNVLRKQVGTNAASQALQEDNRKLAEQNATLVEQLHSCADCAKRLGEAEMRLATGLQAVDEWMALAVQSGDISAHAHRQFQVDFGLSPQEEDE